MDLVEEVLRDVVQAVRLVPALRKDIERDLAANGVFKIQMSKFLLKLCNHVLSYFVSLK